MKKILGLLLFLVAAGLYAQDETFSRDKGDQSVEKGDTEQALVNVYDESVALTLPLDGINFLGTSVSCVRGLHAGFYLADCTFTGGGGAAIATDTIWDAAGDTVYGTGADTGAVLAAGSATQVLHSGTTPSWSAIVNGDITNATIDLTTKVTGKLPYANLADGTATTVLGRSAGSTGVNAPISAVGPNTTISNGPTGTARLGFDPRTQWYIFDDFGMTITGITDPGSQLNWTTTTTNTPGNFVNRATTTTNGADHPGILEMVGNAGNNAAVVIRETSVARTIHAGDVVECQINIRSAATGNGKYGCGFNDATTDPTSGTESLTIYYDSSVGANWVIRARQAAGGNAVASNLAVTFDTWHRLTVYVESIAGGNTGSVHYYVDGTELNVSPLSTNIPDQTETYAIELGFAQTTGGGAVALLWVDYIMGYGPLAR